MTVEEKIAEMEQLVHYHYYIEIEEIKFLLALVKRYRDSLSNLATCKKETVSWIARETLSFDPSNEK